MAWRGLLREYAQQHDLDVAEHYQDAGMSAQNTNRPALQRLMQDCEEGRLDVVLVTDLSRISRSVADTTALVKLFNAKNIDFISLRENGHPLGGVWSMC